MISHLNPNIRGLSEFKGAERSALIAKTLGLLMIVPVRLLDHASASWSLYPSIPFTVMAIMCLALLAGPWIALGAVAITAAETAIFGGSWLDCAQLIGAVFASELLRRGARPTLVSAALLLPILGTSLLLEPFAMVSITKSFVHASTATAASAAVMLVMPRRSPHFPTRCRLQWDLVVFVPVIGIASIAAYSLTPHDPQSARLFALMLFAHLATFALAQLIQKAARDQDLWRWLTQGPDSATHTRRSLSPDIVAPLLPLARQIRRLRRLAERDEQDLSAARHRLQRQSRELQECLRALRETTQSFSSLTEAHETMKARWQALIDRSTDPVLITDARGHIVYANRAVPALLGRHQAELLGDSIESLIPKHHSSSHPLKLTTLEREGSQRSAQARIKCARGRERKLAIRIKGFTAAGSTEIAVQLGRMDGTKQALLALKSARAAVDNARRSRNAFNAAMSHELRTPLHGLIGTLDMLRDETLSPAALQRLAIARASARSLLKIANDILDLSRIEGGEFTSDTRSFSLTRLLQEALEESRAQANARGLQLATKFVGNFPPAFVGDSHRIRQIVINLLSNSLKFTHQGGVQVMAQFDGRQCTIDVIDSGEGIPEDQHEAIFEPFVQVHRSAKHLGAGLGLSISRRLSVAMGGNLVLLQSSPAGTTFRLTLPLKVSEEAPPEDTSLRVFTSPRGHILVVEDHPVNQYVVKGMLDVLTCPVTVASSGRETIELVQRQEFDLILMDCQMPEMDGFETTREVRKLLTRHVPIIAMTANAMLEDHKRCLDAGMDDFLPKPFGRGDLNAMLCKWLDPEKTRNSGRHAAEPLARAIQKLPAIDPEILEDLWRNLKWQMPPMRRIGETFLESVRSTDEMFDEPSGPTMKRQIHTLLGTAGMIGARQIERIAAELQATVNERRWDDMEPLRGCLEKAAFEFERELDRQLKSPPGLSQESLYSSED